MGCWWWFFRVGCAGRGMAIFGVLVWVGCRGFVFTSRRALACRQAGGSIELPQRPVARSPHDSTASHSFGFEGDSCAEILGYEGWGRPACKFLDRGPSGLMWSVNREEKQA
jgi:hypothetical protein